MAAVSLTPARRPARASVPAFAAVDLGTNNCRLLIARPAGRTFRVIDAFSRIVRLGEGVARSGRLSEEAMDRTVAALRICAGKMRRRQVLDGRAVATEAARRAENFETFQARVVEETGVALEVISADEEAALSMTGCAPLLTPGREHALVFDIGGGSTELMWLTARDCRRPRMIDSISLPFGVVNLAEHHGGDRVEPPIYRAMVDRVRDAMSEFEARHAIRREIEAGRVQMLGSSGTVTTLAGLFMRLPRYDRSAVDGSFLDFSAALSISHELTGMSYAERAALPCIGRERADLVVAGCAVLEAICETWPVGRLRIADRGVREGILCQLIAGWRGDCF